MNLIYFSDDDKEDEEAEVMRAIKKCTKTLGKCGVEQTATLMAWSDKNGLNVDKYRSRVIQELDETDDWICAYSVNTFIRCESY